MQSLFLHASCIEMGGRAVLLTGPSGSGKSTIALRLIAEMGATLVADDQAEISLQNDQAVVSAPPPLQGLIEVRGAGLIKLPFCSAVPIFLYVELASADKGIDRLPPPTYQTFFEEHKVRHLRLYGHEAATPSKIWAAMQGSFEDER